MITIAKRYRDAGDGEFVTKAYAESHKKTTVSETIKKPKPKGNGGKGKKGK